MAAMQARAFDALDREGIAYHGAMAKRRDMPQSTLAWVKATILGASLTGTIACGGGQPEDVAPTCGPCCHGGGPECHQMEAVGGEEVDVDAEVEEDEIDRQDIEDEAPTCGPCCHGSADCDDDY